MIFLIAAIAAAAMAGIEVAPTRWYDLLAKLPEAAKGYMAQEKELFAVAENYPSCARPTSSSSWSAASTAPRSTSAPT